MVSFPRISTVALLALGAAASTSHAALATFFGENQSPGFTVSGDPVNARASFLGSLSPGVSSEGFESFIVGQTAPLPLVFMGSSTPLLATLQGDGQIRNSSTAGRFNTTPGGSKWWQLATSFSIDFATPISAFGFYATDVSDSPFNGRITLELTDLANAVTTLEVPSTLSGNDAALLFFGFIDSSKSYKSIVFGNTATGVDVFGFDDMVIGDLNQARGVTPGGTVPEPGSLALAALALIGAGAASRRRRGA